MTKDDILIFLNDTETTDLNEIMEHIFKIKRLRKNEDLQAKEEAARLKRNGNREKVYKMRTEGMTFVDIAKVLNLSGQRCSQIFQDALRRKRIEEIRSRA